MRKWLMISFGVLLIVGGVLASPLPIPFPVGLVLILAGSAILVAHSKGFRRFVQYLRHRNDRLSRAVDYATHRAPEKVKPVLRRTQPNALHRHARRQRKKD